MALLVGGLTGGPCDDLVLADVQEALSVAVHAGFYDVTRLGVNERDVHTSRLLELGDLLFVDLPVVRIGHFLRVFNQQLAKLLLLQALGYVLQFVSRDVQVFPALLATLVHVHLTLRVFTNRPVASGRIVKSA